MYFQLCDGGSGSSVQCAGLRKGCAGSGSGCWVSDVWSSIWADSVYIYDFALGNGVLNLSMLRESILAFSVR